MMELNSPRSVLPGFTTWDFNLRWYMWEGFAWYGQLQVELDGKIIVVRASGFPHGDDGEFTFKIEGKYTQKQVDRMNVIAFKTDNEKKNIKN